MAVLDKVTSGKAVYFKNLDEDTVLRSEPGANGRYFCKFKGKKEYEVFPTGNMVNTALMNDEEITKAEYEAY